MILTKQQVYHLIRGSRVLDDADMERAAYLSADPVSAKDLHTIGKITPEQLAQYQQDELYLRRVEYLTSHRPKKPKPPKTQQEYYAYALRALWRISRTAKDAGDKIKALKELAVVAKSAPEPKQEAHNAVEDELSKAWGNK